MKRTIKEVYDLIKEKRNNAEKRYQVTKHKELGGTIDAYQDVLCLIESSHLLEDEPIESKGLDALEQLKYYNTLANDDFDMTREIEIIETALKEKDHNDFELEVYKLAYEWKCNGVAGTYEEVLEQARKTVEGWKQINKRGYGGVLL